MYKRNSVIVIITLILVIGSVLLGRQSTTEAQESQTSDQLCTAIVKRALATVENTCDKLGRNMACYGNLLIDAEPAETTSTLNFNTVGDITPIQSIKSLSTSAMDLSQGTWGVSLLKLQANLPDTLPGQNVTFLVYGDTNITNKSGNMQSFYFSTGLGSPDCKAVPTDGILVHSPNHRRVTFTANGVNISMASTVLLTARPKQSMTVQLLEGHVTLSAPGGNATLTSGQQVSVQLGGQNGTEAIGAPSAVTNSPQTQSLIPLINEVNPANQNANNQVGQIAATSQGVQIAATNRANGNTGNSGNAGNGGNSGNNGNAGTGGTGTGGGNGSGNGNGHGGH